MEPPHNLDKCLFILILRTSDCTQDEAAVTARCSKTSVGLTEAWFRQLPYQEAAALCNDQRIKSRIEQESVSLREGIDPNVLAKAAEVTSDRILLHYRTTDHLLPPVKTPIISILEFDKPGISQKKRKAGRIISFRLGNPSRDTYVIEKIYLDVSSINRNNLPVPITGPIPIYRLNNTPLINKPHEYEIADRYKLTEGDVEDFEVLCTSNPGLTYKMRIKIRYSVFPEKQIQEIYSDPFDLIFYNTHKHSRNLLMEE